MYLLCLKKKQDEIKHKNDLSTTKGLGHTQGAKASGNDYASSQFCPVVCNRPLLHILTCISFRRRFENYFSLCFEWFFFKYSVDSISRSVKLKPIKANFGLRFNTDRDLLKIRCVSDRNNAILS